MIQVFFHTTEDSSKAQEIANEAQAEATRRYYTALSNEFKNGDNIEVSLNITGQRLLCSKKKTITVHTDTELSKCSFSFLVPEDISAKDLECEVILTVNDLPVGEMLFVTKIIKDSTATPDSTPSALYAKQFKKVFISYAHEDESQVKVLASTYKKLGVEYFLDRDYLKGGDVFGEVISHYIKEADLFILCWSEHAAKSEYVKKERTLALSLAYPQVIPREKAQLSIYPISMKPKAPYPDDMKEIYNFEEI